MTQKINTILDTLNGVNPLIKGVGGVTAMQLVETLPTDPNTYIDIFKLLIQLGIGIATLMNLIRNGRKPKNPTQENDSTGRV